MARSPMLLRSRQDSILTKHSADCYPNPISFRDSSNPRSTMNLQKTMPNAIHSTRNQSCTPRPPAAVAERSHCPSILKAQYDSSIRPKRMGINDIALSDLSRTSVFKRDSARTIKFCEKFKHVSPDFANFSRRILDGCETPSIIELDARSPLEENSRL